LRVNLLAIETSTDFLSLAVSRRDAVSAHHVQAGQRHAELVLDAISDLLARAGLGIGDIDGIAYGEGPGSFTGLRIACGVAQGLALASGRGVIGVSTLLALAEETAMSTGADRVLACIDARMGEVYHAAFRRSGDTWEVVQAPALSLPQELPIPEDASWTGAGSGFAAYGTLLSNRLAGVLDRVDAAISPTAAAVLRLARPAFERCEGRAAESAIPVYIRDRVALKTSER
jgi:tRNA threonylcarbamoyladenosine biosynthesis protein TsaB